MENTCWNTYWNSLGKYQKEYEEMRNGNHQFTKASLAVTKRYYRYYNDGDIPRGMYWYSKLKIQYILERQANEVIKKEYERYLKKGNN